MKSEFLKNLLADSLAFCIYFLELIGDVGSQGNNILGPVAFQLNILSTFKEVSKSVTIVVFVQGYRYV